MDCPYCDYVHDCTDDCEECNRMMRRMLKDKSRQEYGKKEN